MVDELESLLKESTDPKKSLIYQEGLLHLQEVINSKLILACEEIVKVKHKRQTAEFVFAF